ncbi:LPXTG cell wall anchor domain-containing protein [Enterococcus sp. 669A]|uniref:LPXTG cell wall anchor domain-containing protein n=1 Tax=Candidatus Enterococcus moelleringii TaxID=2815325 RepID=A0ABS3LA07_9ENTE|nr:pilin N-terminal domain-containing protein [Enterococcus sp. 669A]MBO1306463.1 LPXTG cell wall anchor domain-containing protein [Enterococcus sp. 669A]
MKGKMKKGSWLGLFSLILCFVGFMVSNGAEAAEETTKVMIHRIAFSGESASDVSFNNNGQAIKEEDLMGGRPLEGATFCVYDVSARFYELTEAGTAPQEAQKKISEEADQAVEKNEISQYKKVAEDKTGKDGIVTFELATYHSGTTGKVYLFMETGVPDHVPYKSSNIVVGLPYADIGSDNILHLYPKNQLQIRRPFFYKYGRESTNPAEDKKLAGAEFRVSKEMNGKTYYLHKDMYNNNNAWVEDENDAGILTVISDQNGLVELGDYILPAGIYYFEETKAPAGYEITNESRRVQVEIPANFNQPITVTVGSTTSSMNESKVINIKTPNIPPEEPNEPNEPGEPGQPGVPDGPSPRLPSTAGGTTTPASTRKLPQTGTQQAIGLALLGVLILVTVAGILIKRYQTKGEK